MYRDFFFPLWFTHFALVLKNYSCCYQNNNNNANNDKSKTNRLPGSIVEYELRHQLGSDSQLIYLHPWDLGRVTFPLCASVSF